MNYPIQAMHFNAGNNKNGNPRRFTMLYCNGEWIAAIDEGYAGISGSLSEAGWPLDTVTLLATHVPTTASFRRECLRESPHQRQRG